jgi:hypothetical protein
VCILKVGLIFRIQIFSSTSVIINLLSLTNLTDPSPVLTHFFFLHDQFGRNVTRPLFIHGLWTRR